MLTEPTALESWAWNSHGQIQSDALMLKLSLPFQNLTSLEDYDVLVDQVPMWERKLSSLLGDINIKYDEDSPSVSVVEYLNYLYRVVSLLKKGLLGADASTTIQPGEFKECTARILRFVSFCVTRSLQEKLKSFCAQIVSGERDYKFEQGSDYWQLIHFQQIWNMSNYSSISRICWLGLTMKKECQANLTMGLSQASHGKKVMSHYLSLILSLTKLQCLVLKSKPTPSKLNHWSSELRMETIEPSFKMFKTRFELPEMRKQRC